MVWPLFLSTFALIFSAELLGKTAFASLILATKKRPAAVFLGAAAAFVVQSAIAVSFGGLIALLPARPVRACAGVLFLVFAALIWRQPAPEEEAAASTARVPPAPFFADFVEVFWVIFLAEWGDLTQLATAALAAQGKSAFTIFSAATLALWAVTAAAVFIGNRARHLFKTRVLNRVAALAFAAVGLALLLG